MNQLPWGDSFENLLTRLKNNSKDEAYSWETDEEAKAQIYSYLTEMNHINMMLHKKLRNTVLICSLLLGMIIIWSNL